MKVLIKLFKGLLWLIFILILLALFTLLAWWMEWPLITGAAILIVLFGVILSFFGLRALYRWHDKTRFVHKVMEEQKSLEKNQVITVGRLADGWRQGMEMLKKSPHRFHEHLEFSQPWFMVFDATNTSSEIFSAIGETLPKQHDSPFFWHFLSSSVLLHFVEKDAAPNDWEEFLIMLTQKRSNFPLRGIVLLLSVSDISHHSPEELAKLGRMLRNHVQQFILSLNHNYSIYVLVEGLESLPGMNDILSMVPAEDFDSILGQTDGISPDARTAAKLAVQRLENLLANASAEGHTPHGDMLEALRSLHDLGEKLHSVLEQVSRDIVHQINSSFAGISFCQGKISDAQRPAFLTGLVSYVLPSE
ncbi:MAG: hypothetical protein IK079_02305, partial [Desulfovibrio sp.]|nr:hypothetical protein [Desulfovibrio sp.]